MLPTHLSRQLARLAAIAALAALWSAAIVSPRVLEAQVGSEGIFLLLPVGARAVGMGQAVVAQRGGSDGLWWNPAAIAGSGPRDHEVAIHHSETAVGQGNALAAVFPTHGAGTFGIALDVLDLGRQDATDIDGSPLGVITPTDFAYGLTYAAVPVSGLAVGATLKHVEARIGCSGQCNNLPIGGSHSNGADLGAQIRFATVPLTIGVAARNLGVGTGDTKPARVDVGGDYRIAALERYTDRVEVHAAASVVTTSRLDSAAARVGTDVILDKKLHARAGYIHDAVNGSSAALGVGLSSGKLVFDIATTFGTLNNYNDKQQQPTYFSLRYLW